MELMIVVHIPAWRQLPGERPSNYRKVVDWPALPRQGDAVRVGNLQTDVDKVWFRSDGRPEIHIHRLPELSEDATPQEFLRELDVLCDELVMQGFTDVTEWDKGVDDIYSGENG